MKDKFMKIFLIVPMLLSICLACSGQSKRTPSASDVEQELRSLVTTWNDAETKRDVITIEKLLAPEFS
jgi:ketosteroid isomerase-like protein